MFQGHGTSKTPIIKKYMDKPKQVHTVASPTAGCGTNETWKILIDLTIANKPQVFWRLGLLRDGMQLGLVK